MIDIKRLESEKDFFIKNLELRGAEAHLVDEALEINQQRKDVIQEEESLKAYQNRTGEKIAELKKKKEDASAFLSEMKEISTKVSALVEKRHKIEQELRDKLLHMPNLTHPDVPEGKNEADNKVVLETGEKKSFSFKPLDHVTLGEKLGLLDFEKASQISGARFTFLRGDLARLERALAQFMLDIHTQEKGYEEICPPLMTHDIAMIGTGQLPKFKEDMFYIPSSKHYLLSTAEIPLVNLFRDEILLEKDLPFYVTAHTPCFRAEAGSYGKDTRGMIRQHQFYKVELVKITHPDKSYEEHEKLTSDAEDILQRLKLPYRKVILSTGDIGFAASKCYDLEVWFPSQNTYREISSCSNCEDFQARRANIRFRPSGTKPKLQFVHTLNGSGLAVGRTLIAVMENFQNEDGSITIPEVLQPYMSNKTSIGAS